jgi:Zn-finger nucleic acid-binding protein
MMFVGAKFCSHCGAKAERKELAEDKPYPCPRCNSDTKAITIGTTDLRECPRCEGIWADAAALQHIVTDREQQAVVLGVATPMPAPASVPLEKIRYLPCPVCKKLMHRVNFANCSNVIADVCKAHGTWFDKDELRRIVEFIRAGGFERARANEMAELERQRREVEAARNAAAHERASGYQSSAYNSRENALSMAAAAVLSSFFD